MINSIKLVFLCFYLLFQPLFRGFFEARAEIQKYFRSFFDSNENFKICFRDLLTFSFERRVKKFSSRDRCCIKILNRYHKVFDPIVNSRSHFQQIFSRSKISFCGWSEHFVVRDHPYITSAHFWIYPDPPTLSA